MLENVEWGEFELKDLFDSFNGDFDIQKGHINGLGNYVITAGLTKNGILGKTDIKAKIFDANTITIDMFGFAFYRQFKYKMVTHARVFSLKPKFMISQKQGLFIVNSFHFLNKEFGYENMCSWTKIKSKKIKLPTKNQKIDFDFMESFITELETERISKLETYLLANELKDYILTDEEQKVLENFENGIIEWNGFNLEKLFGKSTRGKRLKSDDRISGSLPFVTAGESDEGISDFIGNNVNIFSKNTITIDMFGSAKYRNYQYGGDDHISVVHTENLPKLASVFITSAIHKTSYTGKFNYGRNFYPKDADELDISLPIKNNQPDYKTMETLISAIQKQVIKDVVLYTNKKLNVAK
ncbi:restriction endonuclease subunit S [uncultured Arcobacter sp.]|uniref:restriction endonuclease subunit S n=1 Tax=uncultured Arcobacter sp. TaxID=165434 RepID=UPI0026288D7E|nr:restriction endonuclease subunit S [uncultured Arcobacter sp.]